MLFSNFSSSILNLDSPSFTSPFLQWLHPPIIAKGKEAYDPHMWSLSCQQKTTMDIQVDVK